MIDAITTVLLTGILFVLSRATSSLTIFDVLSNSSLHSSPIFTSSIYEQGSGQIISVQESNHVTNIDVYDNMIITMDITIHQIYDGYSQSIFHIGNSNKNENYPAIFVNKKAGNGFKIRMSNSYNQYKIFKTYNNIQLDTNYHLEITYTQYSFSVYLNDEQLISETNFPKHSLCINTTVYTGDPWHKAANAHITNLKIFGWNDANEKEQKAIIILKKLYSSWKCKLGILVGLVLICNVSLLWYLNCVSLKKYREAKKIYKKNHMSKNDIINMKIRNMQDKAAHDYYSECTDESEYMNDEDIIELSQLDDRIV